MRFRSAFQMLSLVCGLLCVVGCDPSYKLTGTVKSASGTPIAGAKVKSVCKSPPNPQGTSDALGSLKGDDSVGFFADDCTLVVSANGYTTQNLPVGPNCRSRSLGSCVHVELSVVLTPQVQPGAALLQPGVGIGPVRLGMTRKELENLGLAIGGTDKAPRVGPYTLSLDAGKVSFIEVRLADLGAGVKIADATVASGERDVQAIAKLLSGCAKPEANVGGTISKCTGAAVATTGPASDILLQVSNP